MNLLDRDSSSLNDSQQNLLSNLIQNYPESELLSISQTIKYENDSLGIINPSTLQSLLASFYETAGKSLRSNADIAHLESHDRSILLHTAVANATCASGQLICHHFQLTQYDRVWKHLEDIYGEIARYYKQLSVKFAESNVVIWKLSMALLVLSTNTRIFCRNVEGEYQDITEILKIQDKYAEILWKYLLYEYGSSEAIKRYVRMIEWFLSLTVFMEHAYDVDMYVNDVESLVEQTEVQLILDDVDEIVNNHM